MPFTQFLDDSRLRVDQYLTRHIEQYSAHQRLQDAMRYSLFNGGKRVRPILVYGSALAIGEINDSTDRAAAAVEAIHAYSLIHDDLPAMDDDDLRRGKPTCHIAFDEATAILAGDGLQTFAFEVLCQHIDGTMSASLLQKMVMTLASGSGSHGMVAGQSIDLASVGQALSLEELENMHRLKTGALINTSVRLGALSTGLANEQQLQALNEYSHAIGLAFQVQDDIIDVTSDTETLGKPQGADTDLNKPTYVSLLGLEMAQKKAKTLHEQALNALSCFDYRADNLRHLSAYIIKRNH